MAEKIEMSVPGIHEAVRRIRAEIHAQAQATTNNFHGTHLGAGALGPRPGARAFVAQHQAAQEVYDATMNQVMVDLERLADALAASVKTVENTEQAVKDALTRLNPDQVNLRADNVYLASIKESGNVLDPGLAADRADAADEARSGDSAPPSAPAPIAAPTDTPEGGRSF